MISEQSWIVLISSRFFSFKCSFWYFENRALIYQSFNFLIIHLSLTFQKINSPPPIHQFSGFLRPQSGYSIARFSALIQISVLLPQTLYIQNGREKESEIESTSLHVSVSDMSFQSRWFEHWHSKRQKTINMFPLDLIMLQTGTAQVENDATSHSSYIFIMCNEMGDERTGHLKIIRFCNPTLLDTLHIWMCNLPHLVIRCIFCTGGSATERHSYVLPSSSFFFLLYQWNI